MIITTNNQTRHLISFNELTEKEQKQFADYIPEDENGGRDTWRLFRYRGQVYDCHEFDSPRMLPDDHPFHAWNAYQSGSHFSAIVIRYIEDEYVIVGRAVS